MDDVLDAIFHPGQQDLFAYGLENDVDNSACIVGVKPEEPEKLDTPWMTIQLAAIRLSESGDHDAAIELLSECISAYPSASSLYNDRCQMYRLVGKHKEAWGDIQEAIRLSKAMESDSSSQSQKYVLKQAYLQRAILGKELACMSDEQIQSDYESSAKYGNKIAAYYAVKGNPYAALCNQMLQQALKANIAEPDSI